MNPEQFRAWRKGLGIKQKEAADLLGLKKRMIQYYEKGDRDGRPVEIPRTVSLACYALSQGVVDFDGEKARKKSEAAEKHKKARGAEKHPAAQAAQEHPKAQAAEKPEKPGKPAKPVKPEKPEKPVKARKG